VTPGFDLVFRAPRVVTAAGEVPGCVAVRDGEVLLPGLVDAHVHVNEPGRTEWEGFASASRPRRAEDLAVARVVESARRTGGRVRVLHLSSSDALPTLRGARRDGLRVSAETCPHYLVFAAEEIPDGATQFKCCPPIREAENRERLWQGLASGVIDFVASDHSPCTPELKRRDAGDLGSAWGGIAFLQLGLPAVWTAARARGHSLVDVVRWMAERHGTLLTRGDA
jgi:allantoinase